MLKHSRVEVKYYSQYRSHDLFELQESLSGLSKSNPLGQAGRPPSLGQDRGGIQQTSEEQSQRCRQQARPHGDGSANREACGKTER